MNNWINAHIWIGEEKEPSGTGRRMFIDNATIDEIKNALNTYPEINILYFGHGIQKEILKYFFNKIRIFVEVNDINEIPLEYVGKIDIILRVSNCISGIKFFNGSKLSVMMLNDARQIDWDCQKLYKSDTIIV